MIGISNGSENPHGAWAPRISSASWFVMVHGTLPRLAHDSSHAHRYAGIPNGLFAESCEAC